MELQKIKVSHVFVPGGFPHVTYIPRSDYKLESRVAMARDNLTKLMVVTGPTKSGKTVLVDKIFPMKSAIWINGGLVSDDEQSFWDLIVDQLDLFTGVEHSDCQGSSSEVEGSISADGNLLLAKIGTHVGSKVGSDKATNSSLSRTVSSKVVAITKLTLSLVPLIVDDFHYIPKDVQKKLVRALKAPIMHGLPVVFIAIPNRKYDAVEVEREMTGRIENIEMPIWTEEELEGIAEAGFDALNVMVGKSLQRSLADSAYGSPFLMQEFCKALCMHCEIEESNDSKEYVSENIDLSEIFIDIAEHSGRSMFDKLKRGPRVRTDRIPRLLANGETTDIYGLVMNGLKSLQPGIEKISYDSLRSHIKGIMVDTPPQRHEISRVLDKIAEISYSDASSTPVIDWKKEDDVLTVTDPFFSFYLRWAK